MSRDNENNLISIDDVIFRAKRRGVDFGKGDPRERLRYLTKIGLLPHAKRKSFNGNPPNGAYPEYVIELLVEIDEKIKSGKSIQDIKKEKEREGLIEGAKPHLLTRSALPSPEVEVPYTYIFPQIQKVPRAKIEIPQTEREVFFKPKPFIKIASILKIVFLMLIFGGTFFFLNSRAINKDFLSYFLASFDGKKLLTQITPSFTPKEEAEAFVAFPAAEPYLTINAETAINGSLNVKESVSSPAFSLTKEGLKGLLTLAPLTANRTYTFPNQSGTVCLSTGNCVGLAGEVLTPGGASNRLAKFVGPQRIDNSSINDLYQGISITIASNGNVGIGIENPRYPLSVRGRIQASGDICTDLNGGRCLSQLVPGGGGGGAIFFTGVGGSGSVNYIPVWSGGTTLENSIIYQTGGRVGIGITSPLATLAVAGNGLFQGPLTISTTTLPQLVLKYDDNNYFKISVTSNGTILFDSSSGKIQAAANNVFYTANGHPIRKGGEEILRATVPIFLYDFPAQTASTSYVQISKHFTSISEISLPEKMEGTNRVYRLAIKYADNIATSSFSDLRIVNQASTTVYATTTLPGRNMDSFKEGIPYITELLNIPDNDWQVEVKLPEEKTIRIFNIFLLAIDKVI